MLKSCKVHAALLVLIASVLAGNDVSAAAPLRDDFRGEVAAFQQEYPHVSAGEAARRVDLQSARAELATHLSDRYPAAYGGGWYDGAADTLHLQATGPDAAHEFAAIAAAHRVRAQVDLVRFSYRHLREQFELLLAGRHPTLGALATDHAGIDVRANRVVAAVTVASHPAAAHAAAGPIIVTVRSGLQASPDVCVSRINCGIPMRGGIALWAGTRSNVQCSLGYTVTASPGGTHWAVTAGHCGTVQTSCNSASTCWGHGGEWIGPLRLLRNAGAVDVARIRVDNSYWLNSWGWMYNPANPGTPVAVNSAITNEAFIIPGEVVCLAALNSTAASCGTINYVNDVNHRGMVSVRNFDACAGDSGGGWYWTSRNGTRWAYGIHHGSVPDECHLAGGWSAFTSLPQMNAFFDQTATATFRVDTR